MTLLSRWFPKKKTVPATPQPYNFATAGNPVVIKFAPAPAAPSPTQENTMSILQNIETGVGKAISFVTKVFTKTQEIDKIFVALSPQSKAALLATYYDATKTVMSVVGVAKDVSTGNFDGAIQLSESTVALIKQNVVDIKNDVAVAKADAVALGILPAAPTPAPTPTT